MMSEPAVNNDMPKAIEEAWSDVKSFFEGDEPFSCDLMSKLNVLTKAVALELDEPDKNRITAFPPVIRFAHLGITENFMARFEYYQPLFETYKEAYYAVECEHYLCYGKNKYANYESFRKTREYMLKNK